MLTLDIRNLYNPDYDQVSGAALYLNPSSQVYPPPGNPSKPDATSNSVGRAQLEIGHLYPTEHTLWIVPKVASADPVGIQTATTVTAERIYRGLRIQLSTGGGDRGMTGAVVHSTTFANGTISLVDVRRQHLTVHVRAVWMKSGTYAPPRNQPLDMVIVHKTGGAVAGGAIQTFLSKGPGSPHYLIDRDGHMIKFALEAFAAGHAAPEGNYKWDKKSGAWLKAYSHWGTHTGLAHRSIGIENVGADDQGLTEAQYQSLIRLIKELMDKYKIPRHRVIGHSDVLTDGNGKMASELRITCPGWQFDWPRLEGQGIGLRRDGGSVSGGDPVAAFFDAMQKAGVPNMQLVQGDHDGTQTQPAQFGGITRKEVLDKPIAQLQTWLAEIGYSIGSADGGYGDRTARAVLHFQTHFVGNGATRHVNRHTAALIRAVHAANPRAQ